MLMLVTDWHNMCHAGDIIKLETSRGVTFYFMTETRLDNNMFHDATYSLITVYMEKKLSAIDFMDVLKVTVVLARFSIKRLGSAGPYHKPYHLFRNLFRNSKLNHGIR